MSIEELKKQISAANRAYRDGSPVISDQVFDDMCEQLESLVPADEYAAFRDSLNEGKGKVKHPYVMGSLDKLKYEEPDAVRKFIDECCHSLNVSAKVDGISCRLHYDNGQLTSASTRGDGSFGEDITSKIDFVKFVPERLGNGKLAAKYSSIDIRGELVILKDDFSKVSSRFANPRNAVAGIMNRKDWSQDDVSDVSFIAYTVLGQEFTKEEQFVLLAAWKFTTAWNETFHPYYFKDKKLDVVEELFKYASQDFEYETDGLVISDASYRNEDRYRPEKQKAFKTNQQTAETKLVDVSWEGPSKDGFFCGVGIVDPVELGGACITRVTLHNLDVIDKLGLMYGSKILLKRSGDVIPHIERVVENDSQCSKIDLPTECLCCGSTLVRDGVNMRCTNKICPDQVVHRLVNFIKKLGVKSASNATLKNFGIDSFEKLVNFTPDKKYKSEVKLYDELYAKVFSQSREKLLGAMNFVGLSETSVDKIVSHYGYDAVESGTFKDEMIKSLPNGIGQVTLDKFIEDLPEALLHVHMITNDTRWHFTGYAPGASRHAVDVKGSICVTGSLKFGSRSKFLELAKAHGYESKSGVTKGLTYLVNNDINSSSSKNRKAKELGVKIISEDDFMKLLEDNSVECTLDSI